MEEARISTPSVVIEGEEIATGNGVVAAVEIVRHLHAVLLDIGGRVTYRDSTIKVLCNVVLHVTGNSLDIGGRRRGELVVDHLIGREEEGGVRVFAHDINGSKYVLKINFIIRGLRVEAVDGASGGIDILRTINNRNRKRKTEYIPR